MKHDEDNFQIWCMEYVKRVHPFLKVIAIPNGGSRNIIEAAKLKRMGVTAGAFDLLFILNDGKVFWCELKVKGGRVQESQKNFADMLDSKHHDYTVCWNQDEFMELCKILEST